MTPSHLQKQPTSTDSMSPLPTSRANEPPGDTAASTTLLTPEQAASTYTSSWIRSITFIALFAALFIGSCFIKSAQGAAIPFSMQTFAIMLTGGFLGAAYGFSSIFLVVALTAVGLPLMNGEGGFAQIFGPTGGFIWMFPIAALLIGWSSDRLFAGRDKLNLLRQLLLLLSMIVFGMLLIYIPGVLWLAHFAKSSISKAISIGVVPFLPGDFIKAFVATIVITAVRPLVPMIRPVPRNRRSG